MLGIMRKRLMLEPSGKSVRGIDLGNWSCHEVYDERSSRFDIDFPGSHDLDFMQRDVKTQISQIKCLLGRKFSDPELQLELDYIPFRVIEGPNGCPLVHSRYKGEDRAFTPVEILVMLLSSPEFSPKEYFDSDDSLCIIGIPMYFTDQQKEDMLEAAKIAGLSWFVHRPGWSPFVHLLDETTAMVLAHARDIFLHTFKTQCIVAVVDFGHTSMQVCFAKLKNPSWERSVNILYKGYARSLGGREFDKVLFKHFASKIRKEYNIDVSKNSGACVRLNEACENLKIDLSKKNEASFCMKFSGSREVKGSITRKDFESLSISLLKRIDVALKKAVSESGLNVEKIALIVAGGKGCSIPAITDILTKIFGKKLRLEPYSEHVAMGCAMQASIQNITGMDILINDLTTSMETAELVSEKVEDPEKFLWKRAMDEQGHLSKFLQDFLQENMHRIERSEEKLDEVYWLSKASCFAQYSYSELQQATNNFHESFKLGEGGFGIVYKGILHKTITIAIKMLKGENSEGAKEFNQEVEILSKVQHPNLVKLIGACAETRSLIYEYLPNGSLEDRLRCKNNTLPLSWQARVCIAFEICSALSFLHCREPHGIVHGDLKPDNILLDENNTSKICDFGLCRELNWTASASIPYHWTDCPKGTLAYMDPEYLSTGKITPQYDVYAFGILLLRLVTCKDPRGIRNLVEEAQKKGTLKTLIDASAGPWPFKEARKMVSLGLRCSDPMRKNRPDMSTKVLKEIKSMLQVSSGQRRPRQLPYFING